MVDPVSLAAISLGTGLLSGAASAAGAGATAASQASQYNYQAGIASQNQQIAKQNAGYALMQGEEQQAQSGMRSGFQIGQIKAAQGASNLNVNSGTQKAVVAGQQGIARTDQTIISSNAAKSAYDYDIGASQAASQESAYQAASANTSAAAPLEIGSSILGSASSVATKWSAFNQSGALSSNPFGF